MGMIIAPGFGVIVRIKGHNVSRALSAGTGITAQSALAIVLQKSAQRDPLRGREFSPREPQRRVKWVSTEE